LDKILKDSLSYLNPNSFYCKITSMEEFLKKSNIYKFLCLLGLICLLKGISNYDFGLSENINHICTIYGMLYMGFKFLLLIFHCFFLFSRLNYLYNDNVKILGLWEKAFFCIGFFSHFLFEFIIFLFNLIFQLYILDMYIQNLYEDV
jgi:hypothetical protein